MARRVAVQQLCDPSAFLLVGVGGSMLAARGLHLARAGRIYSGVILHGWIAAEIAIIPFSWLQPAVATLGLLIVALAERERRCAYGEAS